MSSQEKGWFRDDINDLLNTKPGPSLRLNSGSQEGTVSVSIKELNDLLAVTTSLKSTVRSLLTEIDSPESETPMDEDASKEFVDSLAPVLDAISLSQMTFSFGQEILTTFPANSRYVLAVTLINSCTKRNLTPLPVWKDLVASNGEM